MTTLDALILLLLIEALLAVAWRQACLARRLIHGHRFVSILMPLRGDTNPTEANKEAEAEAKVLRTGFALSKETKVVAKGSVEVGGISIPAIPGTTINGVRYGAPVVPLPEGAQVAACGR